MKWPVRLDRLQTRGLMSAAGLRGASSAGKPVSTAITDPNESYWPHCVTQPTPMLTRSRRVGRLSDSFGDASYWPGRRVSDGYDDDLTSQQTVRNSGSS